MHLYRFRCADLNPYTLIHYLLYLLFLNYSYLFTHIFRYFQYLPSWSVFSISSHLWLLANFELHWEMPAGVTCQATRSRQELSHQAVSITSRNSTLGLSGGRQETGSLLLGTVQGCNFFFFFSNCFIEIEVITKRIQVICVLIYFHYSWCIQQIISQTVLICLDSLSIKCNKFIYTCTIQTLKLEKL